MDENLSLMRGDFVAQSSQTDDKRNLKRAIVAVAGAAALTAVVALASNGPSSLASNADASAVSAATIGDDGVLTVASTSDLSEISYDLSNIADEGYAWVSLPGGTFNMGTDEPLADETDNPLHEVTLSPFLISNAEVTNKQFMDYLNIAYADGYVDVFVATDEDAYSTWAGTQVIKAIKGEFEGEILMELDYYYDDDNGPNHCYIQWDHDANVFVLEDEDHADYPVASGNYYGYTMYCMHFGCNLPTEAQFEYAAKAGTDWEAATQTGVLDYEHVNYDEFAGEIRAIRQYEPNLNGLYDMTGNVWEWTRDWYAEDYYLNSPTVDPQGPSGVSPPRDGSITCAEGQAWAYQRVARGGGWASPDYDTRLSRRLPFVPFCIRNQWGFRPVINPVGYVAENVVPE